VDKEARRKGGVTVYLTKSCSKEKRQKSVLLLEGLPNKRYRLKVQKFKKDFTKESHRRTGKKKKRKDGGPGGHTEGRAPTLKEEGAKEKQLLESGQKKTKRGEISRNKR